VRRAIEIDDSIQLVVASVWANVLPMPRRATVKMSSSPSRREAAAHIRTRALWPGSWRPPALGRVGRAKMIARRRSTSLGQLLGKLTRHIPRLWIVQRCRTRLLS
jgi:hypothetical protein